MSTSFHKHRGWELVLIRSGELSAIVDGVRSIKREGEFIELPIYMKEGPWAQRPPKGGRYTTAEKADELKRASMTLVPR
ncbi:MAG TPA: hypothetical protein VIO37_07870 [Candidatus Dormibacteraeota bacterium]|jgi:uncharacterized cupin superfamily protein